MRQSVAVFLPLLLSLLAAAGASPSGPVQGPVHEKELSFDLDDLEFDEDPLEEPVLGVVARRRKPITARSYTHAAKAQGAFGMDVFKASAQISVAMLYCELPSGPTSYIATCNTWLCF